MVLNLGDRSKPQTYSASLECNEKVQNKVVNTLRTKAVITELGLVQFKLTGNRVYKQGPTLVGPSHCLTSLG